MIRETRTFTRAIARVINNGKVNMLQYDARLFWIFLKKKTIFLTKKIIFYFYFFSVSF